ncbi:MAG: Ig-like domain-containing protein [Chloroflexota bacterium]
MRQPARRPPRQPVFPAPPPKTVRSLDSILLVKNRRRRRAAARQRSFKTLRGGTWALLAFALTALASGALGLTFLYADLSADLPSVYALETLLNPRDGALYQPTRLYDRTGQNLLLSLENPGVSRRYLYLDPARGEAFHPLLAQGAVALFDPDFWKRRGIRWDSLTDPAPRAIPERLAADLLLHNEPPGLRRALRLRLLANQIIAVYGQEQVLEWWLNSTSFGHLAHGADSAAQAYLGKPASALSNAEAALLIAALEAPALNPLDAPAAALENQQDVLLRLLALGVLSQSDYEAARDTSLTLLDPPPAPALPARAFTARVLDQLASQIGRQRLERGGLKIITTLDLNLQQQVTCTLRAQLQRLANPQTGQAGADCETARLLPALPIRTVPDASGEWQASAILLDPNSGEVLALSGDTSLQGEGAVLRNRPAGSLLSPLLALAGFVRGLSPASLVWDIPAPGEDALAAIPDERYHGPVRLRTALANDYLAGLFTVQQQVGSAALKATAGSLGLDGFELPAEGETLLRDGEALDPLELAHTYSVFANLGVLHGAASESGQLPQPVLVLRVEDSGGSPLALESQRYSRPAVSQQLAYLVHHILSDEAARWQSLGYPNPLEIGRPAGAKIGQADGGRSTWAVGYTRSALGLVWLGSQEQDAPPPGALPAAGIWHALMQSVSRDQPVQSWQTPDGIALVDVCDPSGLLPTAHCPSIVSEVFLENNQPTGLDTLYRRFQINRETNRLATVFTPPELVEERTYLVVPPEAQQWSRLANLPVPPDEYDIVQQPPANPQAQISEPQPFDFVRGVVSLRGSASGEDFSAYSLQVGEGINPPAWMTIGESRSAPVENGVLGEWDSSGLNGLYVVRLLVVRGDQRVESSLLQVTVDNTPPEVRIPYPLAGQVFAGQDSITLQAEASDNLGLARVEWWLDGRKIGERSQSPYALVWEARRGEHSLEARAFDLAGNETRSQSLPFRVR